MPPDRRRGVWVTEPQELDALAARAATAGIATQIHAIGDAAVRAALEVLAPTAARVPLMPRLEHVQLLDPADRASFVAAGIAASVQPVHLGSDAAQARKLWGDRAEAHGYTWASIAGDRRRHRVRHRRPDRIVRSVARDRAGGPTRGRALAGRDAAVRPDTSRCRSIGRCARPAWIRRSRAKETDRGRLTVGQRADVVVIPAAALREPVEPGGALATARPTLVIVGRSGRVRGLSG